MRSWITGAVVVLAIAAAPADAQRRRTRPPQPTATAPAADAAADDGQDDDYQAAWLASSMGYDPFAPQRGGDPATLRSTDLNGHRQPVPPGDAAAYGAAHRDRPGITTRTAGGATVTTVSTVSGYTAGDWQGPGATTVSTVSARPPAVTGTPSGTTAPRKRPRR